MFLWLCVQVRKVTAHLRRPVPPSCESLGPGTTSMSLPEKQEVRDDDEEADVHQDKSEGTSETDTKKLCAVEMGIYPPNTYWMVIIRANLLLKGQFSHFTLTFSLYVDIFSFLLSAFLHHNRMEMNGI